jgi:P-type Cu+ transporter
MENTSHAVDPVCGMKVPMETGLKYEDYFFCCQSCLDRFKNGKEGITAEKKQTGSGRYYCPMHQDVVDKAPSDCPLCGMALVSTFVEYSADQAKEAAGKRRLVISIIFAVPLVIISMAGHLFHSHSPGIVEFILATPVVFYGGLPFFKKALLALRSSRLNMFSLVSLGVLISYFYSLAAWLSGRENEGLYFESSAVITVLVLFGQFIEAKATAKTTESIKMLFRLKPEKVTILKDGAEIEISAGDAKKGDIVRIKAGERIAVDGVVAEGVSTVDESMVSGEPYPVEKHAGDRVTGGTLNLGGYLEIEAEKGFEDGLLSRIIGLVSEAQRTRADVERLVDKVSSYFVPAVIFIAMCVFLFWSGKENFALAMKFSLSVLLIACPCALGLATPMAVVAGVGRAASAGILFKNAQAIEEMGKANVLIIDKTGTLTMGKPEIEKVRLTGGIDEKELLSFAVSLENRTHHPFRKAIVDRAKQHGAEEKPVQFYEYYPGRGIVGIVDNKEVAFGNIKLLEALSIAFDENDNEFDKGATLLYFALSGKVAGIIEVEDKIKDFAESTVRGLEKSGVKVMIASGDKQGVVENIARALNIKEYYYELLPAGKYELVKRLQNDGKIVAMAGDGINDAPAISQANVGIAMGDGSDVAIESGDVVLVKGDIASLERAFKLSRDILGKIKQNLFLAFIYNIIGIAFAAGVFYPAFKISVNPMIAALAMSLSSVSVIVNSLTLNRMKI